MIHGISPIRAFDTWAKAGVYYVRTEAMVFGFDVRLEGEFDTDTPESEYVLVSDDTGKPLSTCLSMHFRRKASVRSLLQAVMRQSDSMRSWDIGRTIPKIAVRSFQRQGKRRMRRPKSRIRGS